MATRANPKLIGAFVIGGVVLLVVMILAFGSSKIFTIRVPIVMYFEGDMSGLDVGAAVNFRGVRIGSVTRVALQMNVKDLSVKIPVYAELEPEELTFVGGPRPSIFHPGERIPPLVERGLRAQLAAESLVTGKSVVELSFQPETPIRMIGAESGFTEIPTVPSAMAELKQSVADVLNMIERANLPELVADLRKLVQDVDRQVMGGDPGALMADTRKLVLSLQQDVDQLTASLLQTSGSADAALKSGDRMFQNADRTVTAARPLIDDLAKTAKRLDELVAAAKDTIEPGSPLQRELINALKEIAAAARSARALADDLEKNPDSILFGKGGTKR